CKTARIATRRTAALRRQPHRVGSSAETKENRLLLQESAGLVRISPGLFQFALHRVNLLPRLLFSERRQVVSAHFFEIHGRLAPLVHPASLLFRCRRQFHSSHPNTILSSSQPQTQRSHAAGCTHFLAGGAFVISHRSSAPAPPARARPAFPKRFCPGSTRPR